MSWKSLTIAVLVVFCAPLAVWADPAPAAVADASLAVVPSTAPVVIQVKGVDRVRARVKATVTAALPDFGPLVTGQLDSMFGQVFEGRKMDGVAPAGPVFIVLLDLPRDGNPPPVAVMIRASSYATFKEKFLLKEEAAAIKSVGKGIESTTIRNEEFFLVEKPDYVVLTMKQEDAERMTKPYTGLSGQIAADMSAKLLDHDVSVFANLGKVNEEYGETIRNAREQMVQLLDATGGQLEKSQLEAAKKLYSGMFQVVLDGKALVVGLDFRPQGIALHMQAQVKADTSTAKSLAAEKPSNLEQFGKLPSGQVMYTAMQLSPETMKSLMFGMQGLNIGEGDSKALSEAALTKLFNAKGEAAYSSMNYPPSGVTFQRYGDPTQAVAANLELFKAFGDGAGYMGGMFKSKPVVKPDAETVRGIKLTHVRMEWDLDKMADQIPGVGEGMKGAYRKILGDETNVWFGAEGDRIITVTAKDAADAKSRLESFLDGKSVIGSSEAFNATRKQLPASTSLVYLMDSGPMTYWMADYMVTLFKAMPGLPFNLPDSVKPTKTEPAFIGAAVTLQPERGAMDLYIPVTAIQEIRKVIMQVFVGN